jgi:hypothetical protein
MATDPKDIQLTDEQRKLLAAKAKETGRPVEELLDELVASTPRPRRQPREGRSLLDAMREHGMVGAMQGPGDLSTNPEHMEGFGESRGGTDSD